MEYEYSRLEFKFGLVQELLDNLNILGADGWEIIHYEEKKPKKFGDNYESIVLLKRQKSCTKEKQSLFQKKIFRHLL